MKKILNIILMMLVCLSSAGCDLTPKSADAGKSVMRYNDELNTVNKPAQNFNFDDPSLYANDNEKVVAVTRSNVGRKDPFMPMDAKTGFKEVGGNVNLILGKGAEGLPLPPSNLSNLSSEEKIKIKVNGILYDSNRSSAILNIDGDDYVVHQGDKIFKIYIKSITPETVIIAYGNNIYRKGVGDGFTGDLNTSPIDGFDNMYAGNKNNNYNSQKLPDIKFVSPTKYL